MVQLSKKLLFDAEIGSICKMVAVKDNSAVFLNYVIEIGLGINNRMKIISKQEFDDSIEIEVEKKRVRVSNKFAQNIYIVSENQ
jgi:DtxR family Mn-dependent transcriptional regulator